MKNLLAQRELKKKNKRYAQLPSRKGYAEKKLRDLYIGQKSLELNEKTRRKIEKLLLHSTS